MTEVRSFRAAETLDSWTAVPIASLNGNVPREELRDAIGRFTKQMKLMGIVAEEPKKSNIIIFDRGNTQQFKLSLQDIAKRYEFALIILPEQDTLLYNTIKKICDVQLGLMTVCVVSKSFTKASNAQYFANVALKINLKLGGTNHAVEGPGMNFIKDGKTMVVGYDVTHPSAESQSNAPSIAGMVASIDGTLGQWPSVLRIQKGRQEMVDDLKLMLKECLARWRKMHSNLPENLLIYRDGVSEGQYKTVIEEELPELRKACEDTYSLQAPKTSPPRISIVVVGKRHHTRFYPTTVEGADDKCNPHTGTVVDRGITEAWNWDFFLQSHSAIKGTARPAHYFVVLDEIFSRYKDKSYPVHWEIPDDWNPADLLENLTYSMCYDYGRSTSSVSICPAVYYADILCERGRRYLNQSYDPKGEERFNPDRATQDNVEVHRNLKDRMFYI